MREITQERTIKEVLGYESNDGKRFSTKEECEKYEKSAEGVINADFEAVVCDKPFAECNIYEDFGYGSEEFMMAVVDIKNADILEIVNKYMALRKNGLVNPDFIGKKVIINLGNCYEKEPYIQPCPMTMDMLVHKFIKDITPYFGEEYILDEVIREKVAYRLKNAIKYYEDEAYDVSDVIKTVRELYEMVK